MEPYYDSSFYDHLTNSYYSTKNNKLLISQKENSIANELEITNINEKASISAINLTKNPIKFSSLHSGNNIHIHGGGKFYIYNF